MSTDNKGLSRIEKRKHELERRLEILNKAGDRHVVFQNDENEVAPPTVIELEILEILTELKELDKLQKKVESSKIAREILLEWLHE